MTDQNTNRAFAAAAYMVQRENRALENVRQQYANDKYHDFNTVKEDALSRRAEFREQREHDAQVALEKSILQLTEEVKSLETAGNLEAATEKKKEISGLRRQTYEGDAFELDEVTKNFANTLDEIIEDFGGATRDEMKVSINRMAALMDSIEVSNAQEKDFLLEQYKQTQDAMQAEFNKRASIAARATEKMSELGEQYLDIQSLYAGFVDHNPIMMGLFRMGADFMKRSREMKKAQRESMIRDKKNQAYAEKLNAEKAIRAKIEATRDDEVNKIRQETLETERKSVEVKKTQIEKAPKETAKVEAVDGFDASNFFAGIPSDDDDPTPEPVEQPSIQREERESPSFQFPEDEFSGTGDKPLTQEFMASLFGETDEDGDPTGFFEREEPEQMEPDPVQVEDSSPVNVKVAEDTPEQKAQTMFIRQDAEQKHREDENYRNEKSQHDAAVLEKLTNIESALLEGNVIAKKTHKELDGMNDGGLLEALGLVNVAALFKGPILKALMLFAPAVTALGALLSKIGLGGLGGKVTEGFDNLTERMGGDRNARTNNQGRGNGRRGGRFARIGQGLRGVGSRIGDFAGRAGNFVRQGAGRLGGLARGAGSLAMRGGGMLVRGAGALLGTAGGAVTAAGAGGYGIGTLINDYMLSDDTKASISDFIGPKIDSLLSFFGSEDAERRLQLLDQLERQNGQSLGLGETTESAPDDLSVMEKQSSGNQLVVQADKIESKRVIEAEASRNQQQIEVPVQSQTEEKINRLEERIDQYQQAQQNANAQPRIVSQPPAPTKQSVVEGNNQPQTPPSGRSARNDDSSIQRLTDRFVGMGMS